MSLAAVRRRIEAAAERVGRDPSDVTLIAIGKAQPAKAILEAYEEGQRDFGENRARELAEKVLQLPSDIRWHFVGRLQRNKVRLVRPTIVLLHSLDRLSLGVACLKGPGFAPPALLQVNVGHEAQKGGVDPSEAEALAAELIALGIDLRGLTAIPPPGPPEMVRPYFAELASLRDRLSDRWPQVRELSMGMTDDFEVAVEEGSTMVRVGRAIFGPRRNEN
jgi:pyridoxal phosphate enzyme (YggS family)